MRGKKTNEKGIINQAPFVEQLVYYMKPRKYKKGIKWYPVLKSYYLNTDFEGLAKLCQEYFTGIKNAWIDLWYNKIEDTIFSKTNGLIAMFRILHDMVILYEGPENINKKLVCEHWKKAAEESIKEIPPSGGSGHQNAIYNSFYNSIFTDEEKDKIVTNKKDGKVIDKYFYK
jgi:hypothetical protein